MTPELSQEAHKRHLQQQKRPHPPLFTRVQFGGLGARKSRLCETPAGFLVGAK